MRRRGRSATSSRPRAARSTISGSIKRWISPLRIAGSGERVVQALVVEAFVFHAMAGAMLARDEAPAGAQLVDVARQIIDRLGACAPGGEPTGGAVQNCRDSGHET